MREKPGSVAPTPDAGGHGTRAKVMLAAILAMWFVILPADDSGTITAHYYRIQDRTVLGCMALVLLVLGLWRPTLRLTLPPVPRWLLWATAIALAGLLWLGTYAVMLNYPLTRDEHMAVFDAHNFSQGSLAMILPSHWAGFTLALVPDFLLDAPGDSLLASAYGPGNAAMRAGFGLLLDPALMNPLLAGIGLVALVDIARRQFPDTPHAVLVCALAYILSAQMLVAAMTTYAMTAHMALNLVWLALFLRGSKWALAGTMVIGVWAIGLHQIIFHPLFAGPFILTLLPQRRWGLFAAYALVYAAALLFWINYPAMVMQLSGVEAISGTGTGTSGFLRERVMALLLERDPNTLALTNFNIVRFICWNAAFLIPLAALAWPAVKANTGIALPLAAGIALTFFAMMLLLPYQGHGYGYRYFHAVLGNWFLLAGYGYVCWARRDKARADAGTAIMAGATTLLAIPFLLVTTHDFVAPYASLDRLIERQDADFAIIDTEQPQNAIDQARNLPDLSNRPLRFSSDDMNSDQIVTLCERGTVALVRRADFHRAGFAPDLPEGSPAFERKIAGIAGQGCLVAATD